MCLLKCLSLFFFKCTLKCCASVLRSVGTCLCPQSRTGHRHTWKGRVARMQAQSVAQTPDNVEERRQKDTAQQKVQQLCQSIEFHSQRGVLHTAPVVSLIVH